MNVTKIEIYGRERGGDFLEIIYVASCLANTYLIFKQTTKLFKEKKGQKKIEGKKYLEFCQEEMKHDLISIWEMTNNRFQNMQSKHLREKLFDLRNKINQQWKIQISWKMEWNNELRVMYN